jgi:hypothetical protein
MVRHLKWMVGVGIDRKNISGCLVKNVSFKGRSYRKRGV